MINYDNNNSRDSSNNDGFTIIFDGNNLKIGAWLEKVNL